MTGVAKRRPESGRHRDRDHRVGEAQGGHERLRKRADIDHAVVLVETRQGGERPAAEAVLAVVVVLDDPGVVLIGPLEQPQAPREAHGVPEVDDLDAGLEHLQLGGLILEGRRGPMDRARSRRARRSLPRPPAPARAPPWPRSARRARRRRRDPLSRPGRPGPSPFGRSDRARPARHRTPPLGRTRIARRGPRRDRRRWRFGKV